MTECTGPERIRWSIFAMRFTEIALKTLSAYFNDHLPIVTAKASTRTKFMVAFTIPSGR